MSITINTQDTANILKQQAEGIGENAPSPQEQQKQVTQKASRNTFADFMRTEKVGNMMASVIADEGKREQFITSVISLQTNDKSFEGVDRGSMLTACLKAAVLDLPIDKNLGLAWIITYEINVGTKEQPKKVKMAQFQTGYKAFIQFALRTEKYHKINAIPVYEGQLKGYNYLTEEYEIDFSVKQSEEPIGYLGYFKLLSGFEKVVYWSKADIEKHRQHHNKKRDKKSMTQAWAENYDAMALKTVIKNMLGKWGLLTTQLQKDLKVADESERIDITGDAFETEPELQLT